MDLFYDPTKNTHLKEYIMTTFNVKNFATSFKAVVLGALTADVKANNSDMQYVNGAIKRIASFAASYTSKPSVKNALKIKEQSCILFDELNANNSMTVKGKKSVVNAIGQLNKFIADLNNVANQPTVSTSEDVDMNTNTEATATVTEAANTAKASTAKKPADKVKALPTKPAVASKPSTKASRAGKPTVKAAVAVAEQAPEVKTEKKVIDIADIFGEFKNALLNNLTDGVKHDAGFKSNLTVQLDSLVARAKTVNKTNDKDILEQLLKDAAVIAMDAEKYGMVKEETALQLKAMVNGFAMINYDVVEFGTVKSPVMVEMPVSVAPATGDLVPKKRNVDVVGSAAPVVTATSVIKSAVVLATMKFFTRFEKVAKQSDTVLVKIKALGVNTAKEQYAPSTEALVELIQTNPVAVVEALCRIASSYDDAKLNDRLAEVLEVVVSDKNNLVFEASIVKQAKKLLGKTSEKKSFKEVKTTGKIAWLEENIVKPVKSVVIDLSSAIGTLGKAAFEGVTTLPKRTLRQEIRKTDVAYKNATGGVWAALTAW